MSQRKSLNGDRILVIGIGNELRSDDVAGLLIARHLKERNLPGVQVREFTGDGAEMMDVWAGYSSVFVFDATSPAEQAGTIYRFEAHSQLLPATLFNISTHSFGLAEAVELSRSLKKLPRELIIFGIEGGNFNLGQSISPSVTASIQAVSEAALVEIRKRLSAAL
jgi:hydrogenase maturation protease